MIKFFRKIRQSLIADKKAGPYLIYALGEIVLVVIGILIALAINNLNQDRIDARNEQTYLQGLEEEFLISKEKLMELMSVNQENYNSGRTILGHMGNKDNPLTEIEFSKLLYKTFASDISFNPNNSLLNELINSGNLKNISNSELRVKLTNWLANIEDISKQERDLGIQREAVINMIRTDEYSRALSFRMPGLTGKWTCRNRNRVRAIWACCSPPPLKIMS